MDVVAGTRNAAKIAELQRLVGDEARIVPPPSGIGEIDPNEQGEAFEENAACKALAWSRHLDAMGTASLVIASDGGLLIPGLAGWNPLRTRRFAGPNATDLERAEHLIEMASTLDANERSICWHEAVALADKGEIVGIWRAESEPGMLAASVDCELVNREPGFWIPAIWLVPRCGNRPLATLSDTARNEINDHWRQLQEPVRQALVAIAQAAPRLPV